MASLPRRLDDAGTGQYAIGMYQVTNLRKRGHSTRRGNTAISLLRFAGTENFTRCQPKLG